MSHKTNVEIINTNLQSILDMINALGLVDLLPTEELLAADFAYGVHDNGTYTITDWKGTTNGNASTRIILPDDSRIIL